MIDASNIELFLESLKSISAISRELLGLKKGGAASGKIGEMNAKVLEAQQFALAAQSDQFSLSKRVGDLEKELLDLKDFRREKQNYALKALGKTAFAYVYKKPIDSTEPIHWLCSTCCNKDHKSILQLRTYGDILEKGYDIWTCHSCKAEIKISNHIKPETLN